MNPFKDQGDLLPITSMNRLYVDDDKAYDLFHSALIKNSFIQAITPYTKQPLHEMTLSELMDFVDKINDNTLKEEIHDIIRYYGRKLAKIIGTLFKPSALSRKNHLEWKEIHFDYWASIQTLYLAGGAIIDPFIKPFTDELSAELKKRRIDKHVQFITHSEDLGILGMAKLYTKKGTLLLLDLGQTSIKRAIHIIDDSKREHIKLNTIPAKFLFTTDLTDQGVIRSAIELHHYLVQLIDQTILENHIKPQAIYLSVANYVKNGCLQAGKNSYGKLDQIGHPYDLYLSRSLEKILGYPIHVRLFHDTSAMALNFMNQEKTAIISVGTAFGVGFTEE
jgi:hypothetical protein